MATEGGPTNVPQNVSQDVPQNAIDNAPKSAPDNVIDGVTRDDDGPEVVIRPHATVALGDFAELWRLASFCGRWPSAWTSPCATSRRRSARRGRCCSR